MINDVIVTLLTLYNMYACMYGYVCMHTCMYVLYFFDQMLRVLFISLFVLCGYYSRLALFIAWKACRNNDKVCTSETMTFARRSQQYMYIQPLISAVSR